MRRGQPRSETVEFDITVNEGFGYREPSSGLVCALRTPAQVVAADPYIDAKGK